MNIFFGAAIQGLQVRGERSATYEEILKLLKTSGHTILTEHTTGVSFEDIAKKLQNSLGELPPVGIQRSIYVRDSMIKMIESDIDAAIFEVSTPSLGTGIEIAHAYLRPRLGLSCIPVLALYQKNYWPNNLSSMISGITQSCVPHFHVIEYEKIEDLKKSLPQFLKPII